MLKVIAVNVLVVATVVLIHYECLSQLSKLIQRIQLWHRFRIIFGVFGALFAHFIEIWIFGAAYYLMHQSDNWGTFAGNFEGRLLDCVYFSFTTFTTLGLGDIEPIGNVRYLVGVESLTGLVLIAWTASFVYFEMQRLWDST